MCFHCECKRPADDYMVTQQQERQHGPRMQMDKVSRRQDVSNAWNFDFDDDESDGADVATFEYADSQKLDEGFPLDRREQRDTSRDNEDGFYKSSRPPKGYETEYPAPGKPGVGFNDFDDEDDDDVDSYEIESNGTNRSSRIDFSDIEVNSESEDIDNADSTLPVGGRNSSLTSDAHFRSRHQQGAFRGSEDAEVDFDTDDDLPIKTNGKSNQVSYSKPRSRNKGAMSFVSEDDGLSSDSDDEDFTSRQNKGNKWGSRRDFGRRSSSYSEDEPSSDLESNNGRSFNKNRQRGGKAGQNGRWDSSEGRGDRIRDKRTSFKDNLKRTSRDSRGSSRRSQDNGYNDYKSRGREESYKQQRGRNNNYGDRSDSYLDDERHRRPRINVR